MKLNLRIPFVLSLLLIARTVALTQEPERVIQTAHPGDFTEVAFSSDSKILVGAGANWTKFWDVKTGKEFRSLASGGHILFSRNGRVLAVSSQGRTELRDVHTGKVLHLLNGYAGAFSPDDKILATMAEEEITLWDVKTGRQRLLIKGTRWKSGSVRFAFGGRTVGAIDWVSDNVGMKFFDVRSGEELRTLPAGNICALSPDGKIWASETDIRRIKLWDVGTGKELRTLTGYFFYVDRMAFSPDGKTLGSGITNGLSANGNHEVGIALWDVSTGKRLRTLTAFDLGAGGPIAFSPDGEVLAGQIISTIQVCEVDTGKELLKLQYPSLENLYRVPIAFSPDSRFLATADGDGLIKLWNIATLRGLRTRKKANQR
jgi:WD40 repeat protein